MTRPASLIFIMTTLLIFVLPQMGIDLYLPALPNMQRALQATQFTTQLSLTVYILAMGFSQLVYGPLSDGFGRKPIICIGIFIFLIGSLLACLAHSIDILLLGRIIQGIGMGSAFTIASAILGDSFEGEKLALMTTLSSMVYSLSPLLAPLLGGIFTQYINWQMNFYFMLGFGLILLLAIFFFIKETNQTRNPDAIQLTSIFKNYLAMCSHFHFISNVLCLTLTFGITITFNVVGPFLMQDVLHVQPAHYGLLLLILGAAYLIGTTLNSFLLKHVALNLLIWIGMVLMLLSSAGLWLFALLNYFSEFSIMLWTSLLIFSTGFVFPNCFARSLSIFPDKLGTATSLIGAIGLIGTSIISVIAAHLHVHTQLVLSYIFIVISLLCIISFIIDYFFPTVIDEN